MARSLRSVTRVLFSLRGNETEERRRENCQKKKKEKQQPENGENGHPEAFPPVSQSHPHLQQTSYGRRGRAGACARARARSHLSAFVCLRRRRLEDSGGGHCVEASIWFVTRLFLVPYRLAIRRRGSQDRRPFEGKHGRALVGVYSPAHRVGPTDEDGFKKWIRFKEEKKEKLGSLTCFFLLSIYTCWNNVILLWVGKSGNNGVQVDWKVK